MGFFFIVLGISFKPGRFLLELCIYFDAGCIHTESWAFLFELFFSFDAGGVHSALGRFKFCIGHSSLLDVTDSVGFHFWEGFSLFFLQFGRL